MRKGVNVAKKIIGTLNKGSLAGHLADRLADRAGMSKAFADEVVEAVFDIIVNHVAQGGRVSITNFGGFFRGRRPARVARNPQSGEPVKVPERNSVSFTPSPRWVEYANSPRPERATIKKLPKGSASQ